MSLHINIVPQKCLGNSSVDKEQLGERTDRLGATALALTLCSLLYSDAMSLWCNSYSCRIVSTDAFDKRIQTSTLHCTIL